MIAYIIQSPHGRWISINNQDEKYKCLKRVSGKMLLGTQKRKLLITSDSEDHLTFELCLKGWVWFAPNWKAF